MNQQPNSVDATNALRAIRASADKIMCIVLGVHLVYCLALTPWHDTYASFFLVGLPAGVIGMLLAWRLAGHVVRAWWWRACSWC